MLNNIWATTVLLDNQFFRRMVRNRGWMNNLSSWAKRRIFKSDQKMLTCIQRDKTKFQKW